MDGFKIQVTASRVVIVYVVLVILVITGHWYL